MKDMSSFYLIRDTHVPRALLSRKPVLTTGILEPAIKPGAIAVVGMAYRFSLVDLLDQFW